MRVRLVIPLILMFASPATTVIAQNLCATMTALSQVEDASEAFLAASDASSRRAALAEMSRHLAHAATDDLSSPRYDTLRAMLTAFVGSRQDILRQAEDGGMAQALASARTRHYAHHAGAFEAAFRPMRCKTPLLPEHSNEADGAPVSVSNAKDLSGQDGFILSASAMTYSAIALMILGAAGLRYLSIVRARSKRRSKRFYCMLDIFVRIDGFKYNASIHDLSQVGCKLKSAKPLNVGDKIDVTLAGANPQGRVVWANRHYVGIDFVKRLSADQVQTALSAPAPKRQQQKKPVVLGQALQPAVRGNDK